MDVGVAATIGKQCTGNSPVVFFLLVSLSFLQTAYESAHSETMALSVQVPIHPFPVSSCVCRLHQGLGSFQAETAASGAAQQKATKTTSFFRFDSGTGICEVCQLSQMLSK